jgi:hypothetical protein
VPRSVPMAPPARRRRLVLAVVVVAAAAVGCGGEEEGGATGQTPPPAATPVVDPAEQVTNRVDELAPDAVIDQALATLAEARSYRVEGSPTAGEPLDLVFSSGAALTRPGATVEAESGRLGRGVQGTLTRDGSTFEVLAVDGGVYVRGNLDWLGTVVEEDARRTLGEKWLKLPEEAADELSTVTDPEAFAAALLTPDGPVQSLGVSFVEDQPALGIRYVESGATTWVTATGPVLPLLVERVGATATDGVLRFSDIDAAVVLAAPPLDQVVVAPAASG